MFLLYQPIRNVAYKITPILCAILLYHPNTLHFITISPIFKFTRLPSSLCTEHFLPRYVQHNEMICIHDIAVTLFVMVLIPIWLTSS
jgi:hypothetical protein